MRLEIVQYVDHGSLGGWSKTLINPLIVESVGWIAKETNKYIILVGCVSDFEIADQQVIIKSCIIKRKKLPNKFSSDKELNII